MWALDLKLRATTANSCKSPPIMQGYHAPIARLQVGCAHAPSNFQEITRKSRGSKATHQQRDFVHVQIDARHHVLFIHSNVEINHTLKKR